jgi:hypothetical protein
VTRQDRNGLRYCLAELVFDLHQQVPAQSIKTEKIADEVRARDDTATSLFAVRWQLFADDSEEHALLLRGQQQRHQVAGKALADGVRGKGIEVARGPEIGVDVTAPTESKTAESFGRRIEGEHRGIAQSTDCFLDGDEKLEGSEFSSGREDRWNDLEILPD